MRPFKASSSQKELLDKLYVSFENTPHFGLSELGAREHQQIGRRFRKRFPNLFNVDYSQLDELSSHFSIVSSSKNRSVDSGNNFLKGVFEDESNKELVDMLFKKFVINDTMMRLFDSCDRYVNDVLKGVKHNSSGEMPMFKQGQEMAALVKRFKLRNDILDMQVKPGEASNDYYN